MSLLLVSACLALGLVSALPSGRALAASPAAAPAQPALTPADARQVLDVLNDPAKRAALTATLDKLSRAVAVAAPKPAPAGLAPNSLGAELLQRISHVGDGLAAQGREFGEALQSFRYIGPWLRGIADDAGRRGVVSDALLRLAAVLGVAFAVAYGLNRLMRRPIALLALAAGGRVPPPPVPTADPPAREAVPAEAAETLAPAVPLASAVPAGAIVEPALPDPPVPPVPAVPGTGPVPEAGAAEERRLRRHHNRAFVRLMYGLKRVPFALAHFALELAPIVGFALVAFACELAGFIRMDDTLVVVHSAVSAFAVGGVLFALTYTTFAPGRPSLRLVLISDAAASVVAFWLRLMVVVGAWGFAALNVVETLGMPPYAVSAVSKMLVLIEHTLLAVLIWRMRGDVARHLQPPRRLTGEARRLLAALGRNWWVFAIFIDYAIWFVWAAQLKDGYARLCTLLIETAAVATAARLLSVVLLGGLERMLRIAPDRVEDYPWYVRRAERYYPTVRRVIAAVVLAVAGIALLQVWGLHAFRWFAQGSLGGRVISAVVGMLAALLVGVVTWEAANTALDRHVDRLAHDLSGGAARVARARTLMPILRVVIFSFIAAVLVLTILSEIGVNIAPLLGGAGIIGVAIGFGSQKLVQDFITGIFLLLENTMQVGDWVTLGGLSGTVEQLSIRTIRLRAGDGSLHVIPFSSVSTVTNNNRGLGNAPVSVDIAPDQDPDQVAEVLKGIATGMRGEPAFSRGMLSDLQYWGVDKVTTQAVTLVGQIVCTDSARYGVQREFNRRMKKRFEETGVRLAAPLQIVRLISPPDAQGQAAQGNGHDAGPERPARADVRN